MSGTGAARAQDCGDLLADNGEFVREILDRVGDKWSLLVIGNLRDGPRRYSELMQIVPGISQRMLTVTLRLLGEDGLLRREAYAEVPPRVEYSLTPLGESLLETASALVRWAGDHQVEIRAHRENTGG
ncbi:winged helix-turn-helix transcriptional regulator [Catenuloplanes indicus]|uniref:DNA-binding HxlR family transcriptional regulator n=1 Tax=Catenuloplanes indicus TaxID=137267 RepID=A0AAE3W4X1_9ACTN|nr:helix-turn-helix domain-containing protein [Catenuloplanes indicus]MDQ0369350.1 DNA-binding HxlR family transcriptional regulator [Catenuloplanes indicus]